MSKSLNTRLVERCWGCNEDGWVAVSNGIETTYYKLQVREYGEWKDVPIVNVDEI